MITRQVKILLKEFTPSWENSWIICKAMSYGESSAFDMDMSKIEFKVAKLSRKLARVQSELSVNETEELLKEESKLQLESEKLGNRVFQSIQGAVVDSFVAGSIFDGKQRDMVKEDMLEFDREVYQTIIAKIKGDIGKK